MTEDEDQNITILRKRHRRAQQANADENGSTNGYANGHSANGHANGNHNRGWTRVGDDIPFNDRREQKRSESQPRQNARRRAAYEEPDEEKKAPGDAIKLPFDPWRLLGALKKRWHWLLFSAIILSAVCFIAGNRLIKYKVGVNLVRRQVTDPLNPTGNIQNQQPRLSDQTIYSFMRSGEVLRRVAARAAASRPPLQVTPEELSKSIAILPTADPDILTLALSGRVRSQRLADIANIYAKEVVDYTRDIQSSESGGVVAWLEQKLQLADRELAEATEALGSFQKQNGIINPDREAEALALQISAYDTKYESAKIELSTIQLQRQGYEKELKNQPVKNEKLRSARDELTNLRLKYTDEWPAVIEQKRKIKMLEDAEAKGTEVDGIQVAPDSLSKLQLKTYENQEIGLQKTLEEFERLRQAARAKLGTMGEKNSQYAALKAKVQAAEATRQMLSTRQRDTKLFVDGAFGYYRVLGEASVKDIDWKKRAMKISAFTAFGFFAGLILATLLAFVAEAMDTRLKTVSDIERTTGLPVIATLGDRNKMSGEERNRWAFRTLTLLRGRLCKTSDEALVLGIISSRHGEGRSTWVNELAKAAGQQGLEVVPFDPDFAADVSSETVDSEEESEIPVTPEPEARKSGPIITPPPVSEDANKNRPLEVVTISKSAALVPVSALVWTIDGRKQWQQALENARTKQNTVILIDLPPASSEKAILLAQEIPQLVWLVGSGMADVMETREQLETLRHARCNIVGAVLNFAPAMGTTSRISRWWSRGSSMIAFFLGLLLCGSVQAQEQQLAFSGTTQIKRAKWQERLTLGPGDAMDISLFSHPELTRTNIFVGPDGRLSYLLVQGLKADGMTIEELRARLDEELAKYIPNARTMVVPTAFTSKKYYVLGKVVSKGVYSLDRPMTVIEAVARAQGLETGLYERNSVEMADLSRSFLIRKGERQKLDFEKLFYEGDLAQNIMIEPDDFLYFGAAGASEIYVLGQVMNPGPVGFVPNATIITAITDRGGFTDRAYKGKVLVVRGSLNRPEKFVIDTKDILSAAKPDFKLESRDIIYVSQRPWIRAEELLDEATQSFIQGFVTAFSGAKIGPFIKHPIFGD